MKKMSVHKCPPSPKYKKYNVAWRCLNNFDTIRDYNDSVLTHLVTKTVGYPKRKYDFPNATPLQVTTTIQPSKHQLSEKLV